MIMDNENIMNSDNKSNSKSKKYYADVQKRYNDKCKMYACRYTPNDIEYVKLVDKAIENSGVSANVWLKTLIDNELKKQGLL